MATGFEKLGIGPDKPPKLILDFCWNHEGSIGRVRQMLDALQRELYTEVGKRELLDLIIPKFQAGRDLPWDRSMYRGIKRMCEDYGLPFLCTAFDYKAVDMLESLDVDVIKIGSAEAGSDELICYAADTGRDLLVSLGGMSEGEIMSRLASFRTFRTNMRVEFMYCVSKYPPAAEDLALRTMTDIGRDVTWCGDYQFIGYSSHYPGTLDAIFAVALGAQVVEKHYSLTPNITDRPGAGTDHAVSIGPHAVRKVCEDFLLWHKMRGHTKSEETLEAERALLKPFREAFYGKWHNHKADQDPRQDEVPGGDAGRVDRQLS